MNKGKLSLEIVTPDGDVLKESLVEQVVFRRKEKKIELGSEVAIYPLHGSALVRIPIAPVRYRVSRRTYYLAVAGGFVEVKGGRVLVVTPRFELMDPEEANPRARAKRTAEAWREEILKFREAMIGYSL